MSPQAHELYHEFQSQTMPETFDALYELQNAVFGYGTNIFEVQARNFAAAFTNYTSYPFEFHSQIIMPAALVFSFSINQRSFGRIELSSCGSRFNLMFL
jgi:hypothetical protein